MLSVLIPFTEGVEEIELVAIVDILRRADIEVTMTSLDGQPVTGRSNMTIHADKTLESITTENWDMLVLPGGLPNAQLLGESSKLKTITRYMAKQGKYIAAICAAPKALASFGLLKKKRVTSHPSVQQAIEQLEPSVMYAEDAVVLDGNIITSRGAGTAVAFALTLVAVLTSKETSESIQAAILA
ncbi:MAG TPA: DJ-1/PfpI family protein [Ghiorsea sp.]|nr:DJ-1/PfpI family protein [Ghiorsea sp.]HIP06816.1 DJ-1/PfpI family protein [Mariprofundaceae bacterium]